MSETTMNFRLDSDLKNAFDQVASEADMTSSQLLRRLMRDAVEDYMTHNAQKGLLNARKAPKAPKAPKATKKQSYGTAKGLMGELLKRGT